jgi:phosphatidylinositol alpha-mannosyltransferase
VRIAIVTDYYYPHLGGITEHVHGQATELTRRGHEVVVITGNTIRAPGVVDEDARPTEAPPFAIERIGAAIPGYGNASQTYHVVDPLLRRRLRKLYERYQVDIVHVHSPYSPILPMVAVLAAPKGVTTVGTFHSVFARSRTLDTFAPLIRRVINRLDARIVVSEACIGSLVPYFPGEYRVIPNGIDDRHFSPDADPIPTLRDGRLNILFLGRFDPRNGLGTMIDAFARLRRERDDIRLVVVGDGPLRGRYQRMVPDEFADDVHWAGRVDWSRPRYYASADIHCTPCQRASFGMVLLEAMSCGRPVVASRISGFQLLMEHGRQGFLIAPATAVDRFAEAIRYLLDRPDERERMGREGRRTAVAEYAWTRVAARLEEQYDTLLDRGPAR